MRPEHHTAPLRSAVISAVCTDANNVVGSGCKIQLLLTDGESSSSSTTCPVFAALTPSGVASSVVVTEVQYFVSPETMEISKTKHIAIFKICERAAISTPADIAVILAIDCHRERKPQPIPHDQAVILALFPKLYILI